MLTVRIAAAVGMGLFLVVVIVVARAWEHPPWFTPAKSARSVPPPCVVGTPGCGPLPTLPTGHTPIPPRRHLRGRPRRGLLRPGSYDSPGVLGVGSELRFTVPTGWRWNGQALTKGNAAVYFTMSPAPVYSDPCHWDRPQHPSQGLYTPGSIESTAAALAAQPMRYATGPWVISSSLAGPVRHGPTARVGDTIRVRLTVPSNLDLSRCDHGQYRTWGRGRNARIQQGPGQRDLIWLTGTGSGGRDLAIDAATFPGTPTRLVRQVDAILASVEAGDWEF